MRVRFVGGHVFRRDNRDMWTTLFRAWGTPVPKMGTEKHLVGELVVRKKAMRFCALWRTVDLSWQLLSRQAAVATGVRCTAE